MEIVPTRHFLEILDELPHELREMAFEKVELFKNPANHRRLEVHKLHGTMKDRYSFAVTRKIRVVFTYHDKKKSVAILLSIGDHSIYD